MTTMQMVGATLFGIAILHTFSTKFFEWMAHHRPAHAGHAQECVGVQPGFVGLVQATQGAVQSQFGPRPQSPRPLAQARAQPRMPVFGRRLAVVSQGAP